MFNCHPLDKIKVSLKQDSGLLDTLNAENIGKKGRGYSFLINTHLSNLQSYELNSCYQKPKIPNQEYFI